MSQAERASETAAHDDQLEVGDPLAVDTLIDGRYRVVRALGSGGMGQVYEARQLSLDRRVAVKVIRGASRAYDSARKRFAREARALARIDNQHIVTIFDFGAMPSGQPYLVMEYLEGQDVRALLSEQGPLPAPRAARLVLGACRGLAAAHQRGVIHRDLKPENLFVVTRDGNETCKVLDFGLAKMRTAPRSELQTQAGIPLGTLHYMSPEQARGDSDIDERADVYGCAAVLYELLTGRHPHTADSAHGLLYKIVNEIPKRADEVEHGAPSQAGEDLQVPFIPADLAALVQLGLARDRERRPQDIRSFGALLEPFASGASELKLFSDAGRAETAASELPSTAVAPVERARRGKHWLLVLAMAVAILVVLTWLKSRPNAGNSGASRASASRLSELGVRSIEPATPSSSFAAGAVANAASTDSSTPSTSTATRPTQRPAPAKTWPREAASSRPTGFERRNPYD